MSTAVWRGDVLSEVLNVASISWRETAGGGAFAPHNTPVRQFVLTLGGTLEFRCADDATFRMYPGDMLLAEDTTGTGHSWRLLGDAPWRRAYVIVGDTRGGERHAVSASFVFIGAGGGALPLLQKSGIPEAKGYGGFHVSGVWLRCDVAAVSQRHHTKVYGKASTGSPPMSVPHLDTRIIDGKQSLLFGPYAGFSTKFLKHGSAADLFASLTHDNVIPLFDVARDNLALTEYLAGSAAALLCRTPAQRRLAGPREGRDPCLGHRPQARCRSLLAARVPRQPHC